MRTLGEYPHRRPREYDVPTIDMRDYLQQRTRPVFIVSRTANYIAGIEHWAPFARMVTLQDAWNDREDGHPYVFTPKHIPWIGPRGSSGTVNWLLRNREVQEYIAAEAGDQPAQVFCPFFDETTERICDELGYELLAPDHAIRHRLDSKLVTTRLGDEIGISSVPNAIMTVTGYSDLVQQAEDAGLGNDLVVQLAYGEAGLTTFYIASEADYTPLAEQLEGPELKVMRRIRPISFAMEAVATRDGTIVGRLLRELVGFPELTAQRGGWCGSEMSGPLLDEIGRATATDYTRRFGDRLYQEGYRGIFGLDFLVDADTGTVYLGELNPRFTGSSIISNVPQHPDTEVPLLAIHMLEFDAEAPIDAEAANELTQHIPAGVEWSSLIMKHIGAPLVRTTEAPRSGRYRLDGTGQLEQIGGELDWTALRHRDEFYVVRGTSTGDYVHRGDIVAVVIGRQRFQDAPGDLSAFGEAIVRATRTAIRDRPVANVVRTIRAVIRRLRARL